MSNAFSSSILHVTAVDGEEEAATRDVDVLTPEEKNRRRWLSDSPRQLAARIPNSVFALGQSSLESA